MVRFLHDEKPGFSQTMAVSGFANNSHPNLISVTWAESAVSQP